MRTFHGSAILVGVLCCSVLVLSASCSSGSTGGSGGGTGKDEDPSGETSGNKGPVSATSPDGSLRIVSIDVVGDHVTDGEDGTKAGKTVRLVALVTDKKGSDHIAGGDVRGASGKLAVSFDAKGNGRYEAELGWNDIARVEAISFTAPEGFAKVMVRFVDGDGSEASAEISIPLQCTASNYSACSGTCTAPIEIDRSNCGQCGKQCKTMRCTQGQCLGLEQNFDSTPKACKDVCAVRGTVCAKTCEFSDNGVAKQILGLIIPSGEPMQILTDCDAVPASGTPFHQECCCTDP